MYLKVSFVFVCFLVLLYFVLKMVLPYNSHLSILIKANFLDNSVNNQSKSKTNTAIQLENKEFIPINFLRNSIVGHMSRNSSHLYTEDMIQNFYSTYLHFKSKQSLKDSNDSKILLRLLAKLVEKRIEISQNPEDCKNTKKLVYKIWTSGYGSEMKLIARALLEAFYIGRVLILESKGWQYSKEGWDKYHIPLSKTCTTIDSKDSQGKYWKFNDTVKQVLHLNDGYIKNPRSLVGIPRDIASILVTVHSHPMAWWIAQFIKYVSRLRPWVLKKINNQKRVLDKQGFSSPIIGLHIRRTDKLGTDMHYIPVRKYMKVAEEYFQSLEKSSGISYTRKVYLATDEPFLTKQVKRLFPEYTVLFASDERSKRTSPYNESDLLAIIMDLAYLVQTDYTVCTYTSNICRRVYEYKQTFHSDNTNSVLSLDIEYLTLPEYRVATEDHIGDNRDKQKLNHNMKTNTFPFVKDQISTNRIKYELSFVNDDLIKMFVVFMQPPPPGMGYGVSVKSNVRGIYPVNKTMRYIKVAEFPTYSFSMQKMLQSSFKDLKGIT